MFTTIARDGRAIEGTVMVEPHYVSETKVLQAVASDPACRWIFTKHALVEMKKEGWSASDIQNGVINGQVILQEEKRDRLWRVRGRDLDGGKIQIVVAVDELEVTIKVVTAF